MLEMSLAIVVACLPVLQSLVRKIWPISLFQIIRSLLPRRLAGSGGSSGSRVFRFQSLEDNHASSQAEFARTQAPHFNILEGSFDME